MSRIITGGLSETGRTLDVVAFWSIKIVWNLSKCVSGEEACDIAKVRRRILDKKKSGVKLNKAELPPAMLRKKDDGDC